MSIELPLILSQVRLSLVLLIVSTLQGYVLQLLLLGDSGSPSYTDRMPHTIGGLRYRAGLI